MVGNGQTIGIWVVGLVVHLVALHIEIAPEVEGLRVVVLPQLPHVRPVVGVCDRQTRLAGGDLRANADAQLAHFTQGEIDLDVIVPGQVVVLIVVVENGPVDIGGIELIGANGRPARQERGLAGDAVAHRRQVIRRLDVARADEYARAGDARIAPPLAGIAAGIEMARVVAQEIGGGTKLVGLDGERSRIGGQGRNRQHGQQ